MPKKAIIKPTMKIAGISVNGLKTRSRYDDYKKCTFLFIRYKQVERKTREKKDFK